MWRVMLIVSSGLLTVTAVCLYAATALWFMNEPTYKLGYAGETVRLIAFSGAGRSQPGGLVDYLDAEGISMAYAPSPNSRLVTLYDPEQRFVDRTGSSLYAPLGEAGRAAATLVSTAAPRGDDGYAFLTKNTSVVGSFRPDVKFELQYPVILQNVASGVPGAGVYLLAGVSDVAQGSLPDLFARNGLEVVHAEIQPSASVGELFASPFGVVVAVFSSFSIVAAAFVARIHATGLRPTLVVAVVLGAAPGDLRRLVARRLALSIAAGAAWGFGVGAIMLVLVRASAPLSAGVTAVALLVSILTSILVWLPVVAWVAERESRSALHAIPR